MKNNFDFLGGAPPRRGATPTVALIYDWADTHYGGAEKVLLTLHQLYPQAALFVSFADYSTATWLQKFPQVHTSFLQKFPRFLRRHKAFLAFLLPLAFESFSLQNYDLVISVTSFAAKGVLTHPHQTHVCYLLTPPRFLYSHRRTYLSSWKATLIAPIINYLRRWDRIAAWRPDYLIAISQLTAARSQQYYQRPVDAVIYPTLINFSDFTPSNSSQKSQNHDLATSNYFLCVSRLVAYKKIAHVIQACGSLDQNLLIIGNGPQLPQLQKLVKKHHWQPKIQFLQNIDPKTLKVYYNNALALIAPAKEDFGINLLEANAARTWVITHPQAGARELLTSAMAIDLTGESLAALRQAIQKVLTLHRQSPLAKRQTYDTNSFKENFVKIVRSFYDQNQSSIRRHSRRR